MHHKFKIVGVGGGGGVGGGCTFYKCVCMFI